MIGFLYKRRVALGRSAVRLAEHVVTDIAGGAVADRAVPVITPTPDTPVDLGAAMAASEARAEGSDTDGPVKAEEVERRLLVRGRLRDTLGAVRLDSWILMSGAVNTGTGSQSQDLYYATTFSKEVGAILEFGRPPDDFTIAPTDDPALEGVIWELTWVLAKDYNNGDRRLVLVGPIEPDSPSGAIGVAFKTTTRFRATGQPGALAEFTVAAIAKPLPEPGLKSGDPVDLVADEVLDAIL